jgi:hypothetical protein
MRLRTAAATVFATAILLGGAASTASAGEITGNGKPTQGPAHANSICAFSGLEDGDGAGFPGPGGGEAGATPRGSIQNFLSVSNPNAHVCAHACARTSKWGKGSRRPHSSDRVGFFRI